MADLADLIQKLSFYQAGGTDPGNSEGERFAAGFNNGATAVNSYATIAKNVLEAKKLALEQNPFYTYEPSLPQNPAEVTKQQGMSDQAVANYQKHVQMLRDSAGTAPDPGIAPTPYANPYTAYQQKTGINPLLPLGTLKEVAQAKAFSRPGRPFFVHPVTKKTSLSPEPGYEYAGTIPEQQIPGYLQKQEAANAQVSVLSDEDALHQGTVKKGTIIRNSGSAEDLSPDAINMLAQRALAGITDPAGLGTKVRIPVYNRMAQIKEATGDTVGAQLIRQASLKASQGELSSLQKNRGQIMAFADTAEKNLDLADQLSGAVDRTGSPVINRWLLAGRKQVAGDPDVAKFDAAVRTAINEYARVVTTATGGGVTSDAARAEVEGMLNSAQSPEQISGVIATLKSEMQNRKSGYDTQINEITSNIGSLPITGGTAPGGHARTGAVATTPPPPSLAQYLPTAPPAIANKVRALQASPAYKSGGLTDAQILQAVKQDMGQR